MSFVLAAAARDDLDSIWDYLADEVSIEVADYVSNRILGELRSLANFPNRGHLRTDLTSKNVSFYKVFNYLIVYVAESEPLAVARILHGARDVKAILADQ